MLICGQSKSDAEGASRACMLSSLRVAHALSQDKGGSEKKMAAVNEAYEVLSKPGALFRLYRCELVRMAVAQNSAHALIGATIQTTTRASKPTSSPSSTKGAAASASPSTSSSSSSRAVGSRAAEVAGGSFASRTDDRVHFSDSMWASPSPRPRNCIMRYKGGRGIIVQDGMAWHLGGGAL
jgi:curved DNA-binding protein CbpA